MDPPQARTTSCMVPHTQQKMGCRNPTRANTTPCRPPQPAKMKVHWVPGDENLLWHQRDSLVSRVCRMESLLQTFKLTIFRLETERELDPSHTAHLKQQLAALQQENEEEQQARRREVMKLRDQLQQAYQETDEVHAEVQRLRKTVEGVTATKMVVALAAEELKTVKLEMSQKIMEMKEQMKQESARSAEAMNSHSILLQQVEEMERVAEMKRRQGLLLQSKCQVLSMEAQTSWKQLEEEKDRGRHLEEQCQQLREQAAIKDSLMFQLKTELERVRLALQRQQTEKSKLLREGREMKVAADRVQAERSRVVKQLQKQELLLNAATCDIQTELQVALTDKVSLQKELEKLEGEHALLLQSSSIAQQMTVTQRELLERTIERLQEELSMAQKEEEAMRKDLEASKNELCLVVTKLEGEKRILQTQFCEVKREMGCLSSALQGQQDENRRLMGKVAAFEQQQMCELDPMQGRSGPAGDNVSQTLESILASHTRLQLHSQRAQELGGREQALVTFKDRLQAQSEIRKHQVEVEKLQQLLTSTHSESNTALESLQKALDTVTVDNRRLAQRLKQALLTNSRLQSKLEQDRDQYQATVTLRDKELYEAHTQISRLCEEHREDYECSMKTLHREISELKMTVKDSSARSGDLSKANEGLHQRVSELEKLVSKQRACIREQRSQLRQRQQSRDLQDERLEKSIRNQDENEKTDSENQEVRMDPKRMSGSGLMLRPPPLLAPGLQVKEQSMKTVRGGNIRDSASCLSLSQTQTREFLRSLL
ncbi:coiled-coil domain-containing protein 150-like isoform X3 [Trachinotus anak]|uniref:coiled-coil domain-containing protein 150-like isoform X3 n=2 Tax=Trachinotus anak TaxID=443729 RepID=UPI0039F22507